jgi:hypothetical protein
MVPANRRVSQSNLNMVKVRLLETENLAGESEPGGKRVTPTLS